MDPYHHSRLSLCPDSIRLLRLLPYQKESAQGTEIQCELFEYTLQDSGKVTHLYEALSYAWGGLDKTRSISINKENLAVTENLHAALLRLRDRSLDRILWIDAICINQDDPEEQGQQVQLMAQIYSKATRVMVWLGETAVDVEDALEDIHLAANEESIEHSKKEINQQAILNLLQLPWFQRIWVLQEVAAARHVVMMYGSTEINGYAFCVGLRSLRKSQKLSYTAFSELQSLSSLTNLIEQAGLRPKHTANSLERYSLEIRPLAELVDMFHTCQASDPRDKIYALLGMSSKDPNNTSLEPDYKISWEKLFQQLVTFVLGKGVSVETSSQKAVIKSKGCILGQVSSERSLEFRRRDKMDPSGVGETHPRECDIICLLPGASKPTIIRLCKDHFAIVVIAATPLNGIGSFEWPEISQSITQFLRDFLLIWDWENPPTKSQDEDEYGTLIKTYSQALDYSKAEFGDYLNEATRLWNDITILDDLGEYEEADERLLEARSDYMTVFRKENSPRLNSQCGRALLSFVAGEGHEDIVRLLLLEKVDPDLKDGRYGQTPLSWAAAEGHEAVVKLLVKTGRVDTNSKDQDGRTPLSWAAENGHEAVVKILLKTSRVDPNSKDQDDRTPLLWAAAEGHEAVVTLLVETGIVNTNSKDQDNRTPLSWAAENGHEAVVTLLVETGRFDTDLKDQASRTPLSWAAKIGHEAIVKILLKTSRVDPNSKDQDDRTPLSWAAENGHEAVVTLLVETGRADPNSKDQDGCTPLLWAAYKEHEAVVKILLEAGKFDANSKDQDGRTPLSWAAYNRHEAIVKILLEAGKFDADLKDQASRITLW